MHIYALFKLESISNMQSKIQFHENTKKIWKRQATTSRTDTRRWRLTFGSLSWSTSPRQISWRPSVPIAPPGVFSTVANDLSECCTLLRAEFDDNLANMLIECLDSTDFALRLERWDDKRDCMVKNISNLSSWRHVIIYWCSFLEVRRSQFPFSLNLVCLVYVAGFDTFCRIYCNSTVSLSP